LKSSWSHFFISKNTVAKVGWFDERFPAVGNEDEDYESRLALMGEPPICVVIDGLRNISEKTRDFSYGRNVAVVKKKYVSSNKEFFDSKWELSPDPRDGFTYVRILRSHIRLRPGMETPNFHPSIELQENVV
jgi:hypothetical protein